MRSIILLLLLDTYFNYLIFILLSLFDFNFYKNLNSCFSHYFYYAFNNFIIIIR